MEIINSIVSWLFKKRLHQIDLFIKYPEEVQHETLKRLLKAARNTEYGKKFGFDDIIHYQDFKNKVPLNSYEELKPWIEKMRMGNENVLWPGEVKWFAKSSGTTSDKSKFIPVSFESLEECHFRGGKDMITLYCENYEQTQIFTGKSLTLSGTWQPDELNNEASAGDLSAILLQNLPFLAEMARTPSIEIALLDNWDRKIEKITDSTINENVTSLAGVPSWILVILQNILIKTGKKHIKEVWPAIEVFFHGGVNFSSYRERYHEIIGKEDFNYWEIYNASEGFIGLQFEKEKSDLLLMLDYGIFYEFLDTEEQFAEPVSISDVVVGKNYEMIITTNAGLWRYRIGDTIQFTSLNPIKFTITGRTKSFINVFGEELMVHNAEKALESACKKTHAIIKEYTAAPVFFEKSKSGAHQWIIEFEKQPDNEQYFMEILDNSLKSLNSDYEAKRFGSYILGFPQLVNANEGTFYKWMEKNKRLGGQYKIPRLCNDRKIAEEILKL